MSMSSNALRERRYSHKIQQLTGHDADVAMDWTASPQRSCSPEAWRSALLDNSSSNNSYSVKNTVLNKEDTEMSPHHASRYSGESIPPLEPDYGSMASNRSSVASKPCQSLRRSTSLRVMKTRQPNPTTCSLETVSVFRDTFAEEEVRWRGSTAYNYFSDTEVADEYHRIATRLANSDKRQSITNSIPDQARLHSVLSRRLSLTAKSLFSKSREPSLSKRSSMASLVVMSNPQEPVQMPPVVATAEESVESSPCSVFETSDDEGEEGDDGNVMGVIKDFFVRKSEEQPAFGAPRIPPRHPARLQQPRLLTKTGEQVKDLLANARDGAWTMQTSREDKRRNELRGRIRVILEEDNGPRMI